MELNSFEFSTMSDYDIGGATISDEYIDWITVSRLTYWGCFLSITNRGDCEFCRSELHHTQASRTSKLRFDYSSLRVFIETLNCIMYSSTSFFARWASCRTRDNWSTCERDERKAFSCFRNNRSRKFVFFCRAHISTHRFVPFRDFVFGRTHFERAFFFLQLANKHVMKLASVDMRTNNKIKSRSEWTDKMSSLREIINFMAQIDLNFKSVRKCFIHSENGSVRKLRSALRIA